MAATMSQEASMAPATQRDEDILTPMQRAGFQRLIDRGLLRRMPEPQHVELPILPELAGVDVGRRLDELRDER